MPGYIPWFSWKLRVQSVMWSVGPVSWVRGTAARIQKAVADVDQSLLDGLVFSSRRCGWAWAWPHQPALPFCVFFFPQEIRWSDPGSGSKTNSQRLIFTAIKALRANNFKAWRMMTPGFVPFCITESGYAFLGRHQSNAFGERQISIALRKDLSVHL